MTRRGELKLIIGNMFGNKSGLLIYEVKNLENHGRGRKILALKPDKDTRSEKGFIESHDGEKISAEEFPAEKPEVIFELIDRFEKKLGSRVAAIAIDEVQFCSMESGLFKVVDALLDRGYDVIATGLAYDFRRQPFGSTPLLLLIADEVIWRYSKCTTCGRKALFPQRKKATRNSPQILVGGKDEYEPRCRKHHRVPK